MKFDEKAWLAAHDRFLNNPTGLTDDDLTLLQLVDPKLSEKARARRAGYVEAQSDEDRRLAKQQFTFADMSKCIADILGPLAALQRFKSEERIVALEGRILELEAQLAARDPAQISHEM